MNFKIGDKVVWMNYILKSWVDTPEINWGYVFYSKDNKIGIGKYNLGTKYIDITDGSTLILNTESFSRSQIISRLHLSVDIEINKLKSEIRKLTSEEKDELIKNQFNTIKDKITSTAKGMICAENESRYLNCLKEICKMKEKLFSIKVSDLDNVHKKNGAIGYKINKLEELKERINKLEYED